MPEARAPSAAVAAKGPLWATFGPPAFWLVAFFLVPMAIIWAYSFGHTVGQTSIVITGSLANYGRAIAPIYLGILGKSFSIATLTTLLCAVVGFPVALVITFAPARAKIWLLMALMLPFWINLLIRTYALMAVLRTRGFINTSLAALWNAFGGHFTPLPMLHNGFAVVLGLVYVNLPFMVLPLYTALDRLDRSLIEASLDLGAGHFRTMMNIVVPLALPGILSGVLITLIPALGSYLTPDLMGGADNQMIANVIERQFKRANDWPFGAALSFMLMYMTLIAIAVQAWVGRRAEKRKARAA